MPIISREQIDKKTRSKHERAYKDTLRQALVNPSLTEDQRAQIRVDIKSVGGPKVYLAGSSPKPGAILFAVPEQTGKSQAKNKASRKRQGGK